MRPKTRKKEYLIVLENIKKCPECNNYNIDFIDNDSEVLYCKNCGLILNEPSYYINHFLVNSNILPVKTKILEWDSFIKEWNEVNK